MTYNWYWPKTYRTKFFFLRHRTVTGPYSATCQSTYLILNKRCNKKTPLTDFSMRLLKKGKNSMIPVAHGEENQRELTRYFK